MSSTDKILERSKAGIRVAEWQASGRTVVFTNGCFDILHPGHVDYMEKARDLGDYLVVGLNSDDSVKRLKGPERPVVDEEGRGKVLSALACIDLVTVFDEDTPLELIGELKPDILVKGNDYLAENIVGADIVKENGGRVVTLPLLEGYSTTSIIEKLKKNIK